MSAQTHQPPVSVLSFNWENQEPQPSLDLQNLQNRIATLETQLQKAIALSNKKEAYANMLASDLEHIILQLQRLELVK